MANNLDDIGRVVKRPRSDDPRLIMCDYPFVVPITGAYKVLGIIWDKIGDSICDHSHSIEEQAQERHVRDAHNATDPAYSYTLVDLRYMIALAIIEGLFSVPTISKPFVGYTLHSNCFTKQV